jgi:phage-related protein
LLKYRSATLPKTRVVFFSEADGSAPVLDWFDTLPRKAQEKCFVRIERLAERGHELRRPEADYLRDGIYELRAKHAGVNYRLLYFFYGRTVVVLSHGFSKQRSRVPEREIHLAVVRKNRFQAAPTEHTYSE